MEDMRPQSSGRWLELHLVSVLVSSANCSHTHASPYLVLTQCSWPETFIVVIVSKRRIVARALQWREDGFLCGVAGIFVFFF